MDHEDLVMAGAPALYQTLMRTWQSDVCPHRPWSLCLDRWLYQAPPQS